MTWPFPCVFGPLHLFHYLELSELQIFNLRYRSSNPRNFEKTFSTTKKNFWATLSAILVPPFWIWEISPLLPQIWIWAALISFKRQVREDKKNFMGTFKISYPLYLFQHFKLSDLKIFHFWLGFRNPKNV